MCQYGYIRVSTKEQNEARQRLALAAAGVPEVNIFFDQQSGKDFARPEYQRLTRSILRAGDLLVLPSIDRLGRNYTEILQEWQYLTKTLRVDLTVLDMPLLDTRTARDLTGTLIADIVLQLLSYVAETERANIRRRQEEGIRAAKARGVHFGRRPQPVPDWFPPLYRQWKESKSPASHIASAAGVSRYTFRRLCDKYEETGE